MNINTALLSNVYIVSVLITMIFAFQGNAYMQIALKICNIGVLLMLYLISVPKNEQEKLYIITLCLLLIGHINFTFPNLSNFDFTFFPYLISHILMIWLICKNYLKNESIKDILVFALPFSLSFIVFAILLLNLTLFWFIKSVFLGFLACINCSVVLLVYVKKTSIKNYMLFFGVFMWFLVDAFCAIFMFNGREEIFYFLTLILDWIAQFMICKSLIMKEELDSVTYYTKHIE